MSLDRVFVGPGEPIRVSKHRPDVAVELHVGIRNKTLGVLIVNVLDNVPEGRRGVDPPSKIRRTREHPSIMTSLLPVRFDCQPAASTYQFNGRLTSATLARRTTR